MTKSTSASFIQSANELGTACGSARGCGAQVNTTLGRSFFLYSSIVIKSAKACNGWPVAASIENTGLPEYLMN